MKCVCHEEVKVNVKVNVKVKVKVKGLGAVSCWGRKVATRGFIAALSLAGWGA